MPATRRYAPSSAGRGWNGRGLDQRDGRFETEWTASDANLAVLDDLSGTSTGLVRTRRPPDGIILAMNSAESWCAVPEPVIAPYGGHGLMLYVYRCNRTLLEKPRLGGGKAPASLVLPGRLKHYITLSSLKGGG